MYGLSKTKFLDTSNELRIRLRKTLNLPEISAYFFHEKTDKLDQCISATLLHDGETVDVVLSIDKVRKLLNEDYRDNRKQT